MAVAARQVQIAKGEDHIVAVERDIVYDEKAGKAAEIKKTTVLVDLGGGRIGQATQTEVTAIQLDGPARAPQGPKPAITNAQRQPAATTVVNVQPARQDPPPTYRGRASSSASGLKDQVREAKDNSSNKGYFLFDLCSIFTGKICCLVTLVIILALPVAMIVMGALYLDQCPGEPFIPIWSLAFGCVASAQLLLSLTKWCLCRKKDDESVTSERLRKIVSLIETLSILFLIGWLIAGSVWVFSFKYSIGSCPTAELDDDCCHQIIVWFSIGSISAVYAFGLLICCCCCCLIGFALNTNN